MVIDFIMLCSHILIICSIDDMISDKQWGFVPNSPENAGHIFERGREDSKMAEFNSA